jgi:transcriptional regulator GlxA family with amidase domain
MVRPPAHNRVFAEEDAAALGSDPRLRVGFVLVHNFTLTAFSAFLDMLRLAADDGDHSRPISCTWRVMNADRRPVRASCGIEIQPSSGWVDPENFDFIVVVGGLLHGKTASSPGLDAYVRRAASAGVPLVGLCTGSFLLCRLGLMEGRQCCVSWYHYQDFIEQFPNSVPVADRLFVVDGDRITSSGGAGVVHLAAHLVTRSLGAARALKALNILLVPHPLPGDDAQPAPPLSVGRDDEMVSRALLLMEQNLSRPITLAKLSAALGMSLRQLERRFSQTTGQSPQKSYLALRLRHGKWMLENSALSVGQIAAEMGFADSSHFSRAFKVRFGEVPATYRRAAARALRSRSGGENADRRVFY